MSLLDIPSPADIAARAKIIKARSKVTRRGWSEDKRIAQSERMQRPEVKERLRAKALERMNNPAFVNRMQSVYAKRRLKTINRDISRLLVERSKLEKLIAS